LWTFLDVITIQELCKAMGASLTVISKVGEGSTFSIVMPLKRCLPSALYRKAHVIDKGEMEGKEGKINIDVARCFVVIDPIPFARAGMATLLKALRKTSLLASSLNDLKNIGQFTSAKNRKDFGGVFLHTTSITGSAPHFIYQLRSNFGFTIPVFIVAPQKPTKIKSFKDIRDLPHVHLFREPVRMKVLNAFLDRLDSDPHLERKTPESSERKGLLTGIIQTHKQQFM
jgi:hypothetical protein